METFLAILEAFGGPVKAVSLIFMAVFIVFILSDFVNGTRKIDKKSLYVDERSGAYSSTKYWMNVANTAATAAFLYINLFRVDIVGADLAMLWLVYLGVIGGNAAASKFISNRYGSTPGTQPQVESYQPPQSTTIQAQPTNQGKQAVPDSPD